VRSCHEMEFYLKNGSGGCQVRLPLFYECRSRLSGDSLITAFATAYVAPPDSVQPLRSPPASSPRLPCTVYLGRNLRSRAPTQGRRFQAPPQRRGKHCGPCGSAEQLAAARSPAASRRHRPVALGWTAASSTVDGDKLRKVRAELSPQSPNPPPFSS
jgi:hypothetical protein